MSNFDVIDYINTYVTSTPKEMKSSTMVLFFAFRDGEEIGREILKSFPKDIYTDKVLNNMVSSITGGSYHENDGTFGDYIHRFLKKSWEFCLADDDVINELVDVETNFIEKEKYTSFYVVKYKTTDDKMNEVVMEILMDLDCCLIGGYLIKSAEDIKL